MDHNGNRMCADDDEKSELRVNPTNGRILELCPWHAELHDKGLTFRVYPVNVERNR